MQQNIEATQPNIELEYVSISKDFINVSNSHTSYCNMKRYKIEELNNVLSDIKELKKMALIKKVKLKNQKKIKDFLINNYDEVLEKNKEYQSMFDDLFAYWSSVSFENGIPAEFYANINVAYDMRNEVDKLFYADNILSKYIDACNWIDSVKQAVKFYKPEENREYSISL